jgi:glycosyltransferase involved in cell wall biosynthesis
MEPRVSVIIANKNYGKYLNRAIDSAYAQKYNPDKISIIVCDDGSTDNSLEVLQQYESRPNFQYIANDISRGQGYARNACIEKVWDNTDIFAILDADDVMLPNKTAILSAEIANGRGFIGVSYADYVHFYEDGKPDLLEFKEPFSRERLYSECIVHSNAFISKEALAYVKQKDGFFFDETLCPCEDYDLWLRIASKFMISHVPLILSKVLVHNQNSTNTTSNQHRAEKLQRIWNKLTASQ